MVGHCLRKVVVPSMSDIPDILCAGFAQTLQSRGGGRKDRHVDLTLVHSAYTIAGDIEQRFHGVFEFRMCLMLGYDFLDTWNEDVFFQRDLFHKRFSEVLSLRFAYACNGDSSVSLACLSRPTRTASYRYGPRTNMSAAASSTAMQNKTSGRAYERFAS